MTLFILKKRKEKKYVTLAENDYGDGPWVFRVFGLYL